MQFNQVNKKPMEHCPLYSGPLGDCEVCDKDRGCGLWLAINRLNNVEIKVRDLESRVPKS